MKRVIIYTIILIFLTPCFFAEGKKEGEKQAEVLENPRTFYTISTALEAYYYMPTGYYKKFYKPTPYLISIYYNPSFLNY